MALVVLGSGCIGYNQTVFYTKSNVGLDFDSKPPTTEISVSRKEGVIAPSFEGGQTPPVMASFQPHGGNGNTLENFFLGVDQTFAGGDAAIAMAELYDSPLAGSTAANAYDSAITVADPTTRFDWQKVPAGPTARPFIFVTDTLWGVKIGWTGQVPDSVKAGFNREEIAWAPISKECASADCKSAEKGEACVSTNCIPGRVKLRGPSFLASIDHDIEIKGASAKTGSIQYFATGRAATLLARQPAVRKAMLTRMDPAIKLDPQTPVLGEALVMVESVVYRRDQLGDELAKKIQDRLDTLTGIDVPAAASPAIGYNTATKVVTESIPAFTPSTANLGGLITYNRHLDTNAARLKTALQAISGGSALTYAPVSGAAVTDKSKVLQKLLAVQLANNAESERFRRQLSSNPTVIDAYMFALGSVMPR